MISKTTLIIASIIIYVVLASIGCKALAATFYSPLAAIYGSENVQIAGCYSEGKDYGHAYLIVNGKPYEPRFMVLFTLPHIDYTNPIQTWDNVEHFRKEYS